MRYNSSVHHCGVRKIEEAILDEKKSKGIDILGVDTVEIHRSEVREGCALRENGCIDQE